MKWAPPNDLLAELTRCGLAVSVSAPGLRFTSERQRFHPFSARAGLLGWGTGETAIGAGTRRARFRDTALRLSFSDGDWMLVYASGHIRWIPRDGLTYFSILSRGRAPDLCQGDLVGFDLSAEGAAGAALGAADPALRALAPGGSGALWAERPTETPSDGRWHECSAIPLGGNSRHAAEGRLRWRHPIAFDPRTVVLEALDVVWLTHDPIDDIHPRLRLQPGRRLLITKLPGFSDPAIEMSREDAGVAG